MRISKYHIDVHVFTIFLIYSAGYARGRLPPLRNTPRANNDSYHGYKQSRSGHYNRSYNREQSESDCDDSDYHDNRRSRRSRNYHGYREQETSTESDDYYAHY